MRNSTYAALFRGLAERHLRIRHRDDSPRFARVIMSVDPLQREADFYEMQQTLLGRYLQPGAGEQVMVLESMMTQYQDNGGDNYQRQRRGAFYILEQAVQGEDAWNTLDRTEETGEEILAALLEQFEDDPKIRWSVGSIQSDAVGPLHDGTWYGTRFDFEFHTPANAALAYNAAAFN